MKSGMTITELAAELERQHAAKRDFVADTRKVEMTDDARGLTVGEAGRFDLAPHAARQLATALEIPAVFYDRLQDKHPDLLAGMVNQLFQREPEQRMIRTLDGRARAILSSRYRPLDNYDLADAVFPLLVGGGIQVESAQVTDSRLYIKASIPGLERELPPPEGAVMGKGHTIFVRAIRAAFVITNSETGAGALSVSPAVVEKACTNLAVFKDEGYGRMHVGRRAGEENGIREDFTDETKRMSDAAVWAQVRDVVRAAIDGRAFEAIVKRLTDARADVIEGDPIKVVELFAKKEQLTETEKGGLLRHLVASGEMSRYGLQWAVTRLAGEVEDYDRASELERLGGRVIELPRSDWTVYAKAA